MVLAGLINPILPPAGNILSSIVHYVYLNSTANGTRPSQRFPTVPNPIIVPVNRS
jgi:hypothetical protein